MADLIYLSLSLNNYSAETMLQHWQKVLEAFPASQFQGMRSLTIHPFDWSETPVFERTFGDDATPADATALAAEFLHDDYAYEVEMNWDLWVPDDPAKVVSQEMPDESEPSEVDDDFENSGARGTASNGWHRAPVVVSISCLGPEFEQEIPEDRADIQIKFGLDTPFLPPEEDVLFDSDQDLEVADLRIRENLQQLLQFVHELDEILPVRKRLLWCDSGENLAEKIMDAWNERI